MKLLFTFLCGAELFHISPKSRTIPFEPSPASGPRLGESHFPEPWLLIGSKTKVCDDACACFQTYRQLLSLVESHRGKHELLTPTKGEAHVAQRDGKVANVDYFNAPAPAISSTNSPAEIAAWCHAQSNPISVKGPPSVDDPKGGPKKGDSESDSKTHDEREGGQQ